MAKSELITNPQGDLPQLCEQYNGTLKSLLDKHAPVRSKSVKVKPPAPWMSPDIINTKVRFISDVEHVSFHGVLRSRQFLFHFCF